MSRAEPDCRGIVRKNQLTRTWQQTRHTSTSTTITAMGHPATMTDSLPQPTIVSVQTALTSHPPSAPIRRSETAPVRLMETDASQLGRSVSKSSTVATAVDDELKNESEICLSPSWSEFGTAKKKKEKKQLERAQKETNKKQRKADEMKAKRLSKKPPAAMDTQKPSSALRRNSGVSFTSSRSSSRDDSRRFSRGERGLSEISHQSSGQRRSQSTPATSTDLSQESRSRNGRVTGSAAPQLPKLESSPKLDSFAWHNRNSSAGTGQTDSSAGDKAYEKNLVDFAYRLEASTTTMDPWKPTPPLVKGLRASWRPESPSFSRSRTMPDLMSQEQPRVTGKTLEQRQGSNEDASGKVNHLHGHGQPRVVYRRPLSTSQAADTAATSATDGPPKPRESGRMHPVHAPNADQRGSLSPIKLPKDGSSYVHKQRMHQQQLSIASFQDEQAVKDANENNDLEPLAENESVEKEVLSLGTSVTASSESSRGPTRQTSLDCECKDEIDNDPERRLGPKETPMEEFPINESTTKESPTNQSKDITTLNSTAATPGSKTDRILNFRPFLRKSKQPNPPGKPAVSTASSNGVATASPKQPKLGRAVFSLPKSSKSDKIPVSVKLVPAEISGPEPTQNDTVQPPEIERPSIQTHSRTRTSSSQLMTNDMLMHKHFRRPSTAPSLPLLDPQASLASKLTPAGDTRDALHSSGDERHPETNSKGQGENRLESEVPPPAPPAVIVEGVTGEGLVHKTSIKRPRSNPMLQTFTQASSPLPSLDFLPELKHQPLVKPKRTSPVIPHFPGSPEKAPFNSKPPPLTISSPLAQSESRSISPTRAKDLHVLPRSPLRLESHHPSSEGSLLRPELNSRRRTMGPAISSSRPMTMGPLSFGRGGTAEGLEAKPVAKLFVICCKCKFWHDLPSRLYELMALPQKLSRSDSPESAGALEKTNQATLDTMVKCPWCDHYMTTWCCAGWTTVVYLHERHH